MKILSAIKKELLEIFHDRTMLFAIVIFPVFVMLFMGSAFGSLEISGLPVGVVGPTDTTFSSVLFEGLNQSNAFNLQNFRTETEAMSAFRNGQLRAVIIVPEDFETKISQGGGAEVRIAIDNSDIALQEAILAAMGSVVQASSTDITRSYVSAAWDDLHELNASASVLASDINKSKAKMESTRQKIGDTRQNMDRLDIEGLEQSIENASAEIVKMNHAVSQQNQSGFLNKSEDFLYDAGFALNQSIATVGDTHERLTEQAEELNETSSTLSAAIAGLKTIRSQTTDAVLIAALDLNIASLKSLYNTTTQQEKDTAAQIEELENLNDTLQEFRISLEGYDAELSDVKENQTELLGDLMAGLSSMDASFDEARGTVSELKDLFSEINSTTAEIDTTLDEALVQIESVNGLISSLQSTVAAQTEKDPETIAAPLSVKVEDQYVRNSFVDFIIPRVIAVSLLFSCFLLSSISLVREKTGKTVIRLLMAPGAFANVIAAKVASITLISLGQVTVILLIAFMLFAVKPPENLMAVAAGTVIASLVLSSIGTLVGFYARTESAAIQTSLVLAIPMLFLGNIIFSPDLLPVYTQVLQQLLPLAHITNIFKVVLITSGNPAADIAALLSYFVLLALIIAIIVIKRRDITHYI